MTDIHILNRWLPNRWHRNWYNSHWDREHCSCGFILRCTKEKSILDQHYIHCPKCGYRKAIEYDEGVDK